MARPIPNSSHSAPFSLSLSLSDRRDRARRIKKKNFLKGSLQACRAERGSLIPPLLRSARARRSGRAFPSQQFPYAPLYALSRQTLILLPTRAMGGRSIAKLCCSVPRRSKAPEAPRSLDDVLGRRCKSPWIAKGIPRLFSISGIGCATRALRGPEPCSREDAALSSHTTHTHTRAKNKSQPRASPGRGGATPFGGRAREIAQHSSSPDSPCDGTADRVLFHLRKCKARTRQRGAWGGNIKNLLYAAQPRSLAPARWMDGAHCFYLKKKIKSDLGSRARDRFQFVPRNSFLHAFILSFRYGDAPGLTSRQAPKPHHARVFFSPILYFFFPALKGGDESYAYSG